MFPSRDFFIIVSERGRARSREHLPGPYPWTIGEGQSELVREFVS
jgi:hypothetical protein